MDDFDVTVPEVFRPYAELAIGRLKYLHPRVTFVWRDETISVSGSASGVIRRDVHHQLYREKIPGRG